ncbi:MAG: hypothetical protein C0617_07735 [Desulfuromonas sp.]|uniref:STAS domain-containing protein n=1 Tax=Desulfuromonas sp. TaxID=892 RepID=UPI000CAAA06A|nr:STAS domain-containing protein [Desulfuromonas sp.]PLX84512.1 MAG: hypothetical protein C0617_07735 [Desulfuromonas sp.]
MSNTSLEPAPDAQGNHVLTLEGEVTVEILRELKETLAERLDSARTLELDCGKVTGIDVYAIQLLCSAHRSAMAAGKGLGFAGDPSEKFREMVRVCGFERKRGCSLCQEGERCLWMA